tara:strand:+ start:117 stop:320 length:204 start_codon:yes stop_codon:yes gene_type:complete
MRAEYLYRFQDNYDENGFKRLIKEGFNVKKIHYNYIPTATGPGHASIFLEQPQKTMVLLEITGMTED